MALLGIFSFCFCLFCQSVHKKIKSCNLRSAFADCTGNLILVPKGSCDGITCMFLCYCNIIVLFRLNEGKGQQQFELSLKQLLQSMTGMMCYNTDSTVLVQGACLKYLPSTIPDILTVFSATELR